MKGLRVTKIVKEIKFGEIWGELEAKKCLQRQSFTKYLRLALASMSHSALRKKFNFCFSRAFLLVLKFSFCQGNWALGYHSMEFGQFPPII